MRSCSKDNDPSWKYWRDGVLHQMSALPSRCFSITKDPMRGLVSFLEYSPALQGVRQRNLVGIFQIDTNR